MSPARPVIRGKSFSLERVPESLLVIGGRPVGCELGPVVRVGRDRGDNLLPAAEAHRTKFHQRMSISCRAEPVDSPFPIVTALIPGFWLLLQNSPAFVESLLVDFAAGKPFFKDVGRRPVG